MKSGGPTLRAVVGRDRKDARYLYRISERCVSRAATASFRTGLTSCLSPARNESRMNLPLVLPSPLSPAGQRAPNVPAASQARFSNQFNPDTPTFSQPSPHNQPSPYLPASNNPFSNSNGLFPPQPASSSFQPSPPLRRPSPHSFHQRRTSRFLTCPCSIRPPANGDLVSSILHSSPDPRMLASGT